jgi:hypothetical protein
VILVDVNVLIYAVDSDAPQHPAVQPWLDRALSGLARVGLPWHSLLGFWRITTNPRAFERPLRADEAWAQISDWLDRPAAYVPTPGERHRQILDSMVATIRPAGNLVPDAHLAALAIEHGLMLATTDTGFSRFSNLRTVDPSQEPTAGDHPNDAEETDSGSRGG